jgi:hypothetical protein
MLVFAFATSFAFVSWHSALPEGHHLGTPLLHHLLQKLLLLLLLRLFYLFHSILSVQLGLPELGDSTHHHHRQLYRPFRNFLFSFSTGLRIHLNRLLVSIRIILHFNDRGLFFLFFFPFLIDLIKNLFSIEDKEYALEEFLSDFI